VSDPTKEELATTTVGEDGKLKPISLDDLEREIINGQNSAAFSSVDAIEEKGETVPAKQDAVGSPMEELKQDEEEESEVVLPEELKSIGDTPKAIVEKFAELQSDLAEANASNDELVSLIEPEPLLIETLKLVKSGIPFRRAVLDVMSVPERIPSIEEDGEEKVREYLDKAIEAEHKLKEKRRAAEQRRKQEAERTERLVMQVESMEKAFRSAHPEITDADMEANKDFLRRMFYGDPVTGELPKNFFEAIHHARTYKDAISKKEEEASKKAEEAARQAKIEGAKKALQAKLKSGGDGLPAVGSQSPLKVTVEDALSPLEKEIEIDSIKRF
jgi:hypothetical protein